MQMIQSIKLNQTNYNNRYKANAEPNRQIVNFKGDSMALLRKVCQGDFEAQEVCLTLMSGMEKYDPQNAFGGLGALVGFDTAELKGRKIGKFFYDICGQNIEHAIKLLRAVQLGLLNKQKLHHAIENSGEGININELVKAVNARLGYEST